MSERCKQCGAIYRAVSREAQSIRAVGDCGNCTVHMRASMSRAHERALARAYDVSTSELVMWRVGLGFVITATVIALVLMLANCAGNQSQVNWPRVASCVTAPASTAVSEVASTLLAGGSQMDAQLERVALTYGASVVACAVAQLVQQWSASPIEGVYPAPEGDAAKRGSDWLQRHDIAVQRP